MEEYVMSNVFHLTKTDYEDGSNFSIQQGSSFDWLVFYYPEDISTWLPRGQIRTNYAQKGGELIAEFDFDLLVYASQTIDGVTAFRTKIRPKLSATQTEAMNFNLRTRKSSDEIAVPGRNVWVYDIELEHPTNGTVIKLSRGFVEVELETTTG
jgi:hypothetical protein